MALVAKEWTQREWIQSQVELFHNRGDFYNLSGLSPDVIREALKRSPAWSSHLTHAGLTGVKGMFYDENNKRYVLLGTNADSHLASTYFSSSWVAKGTIYELSAATSGLAGLSQRNVAFFGGYLYVIGFDSHVYRGSSYTSTLSDFYATADARCLAPFGGRMYMASTYGKIWRLNDADNAFETHYDSIANFYPLYMTAFRGYLLIVGEQDDGTIHFYRLSQSASGSNPNVLQELAKISATLTDYGTYGCLFALHNDQLYFSPGPYTNPDSTKVLDIYTFNGSQVKRIAQLPASTASPAAAGLVHWRGELIFYAPASSGTQNYKMLLGNQFVDAVPGTINVTGLSAIAANLGNELVTVGLDGSSNEGIHHAGGSDLQDGHLITARLDMDHPGFQKRLDRIVVLLNGAATDFKIVIKYRTDDTSSWTTTATANNTRRALADNLSTHFYTLQLRIELDDDTGAGNQDIRILAVSVIYSI